jgi:hypothetical protein
MPELAERTRSGPGRLLITVYAVFALAATARSAVQIGTRFDEAPLAYLLSAFAAVVYVLATICLARGSTTARGVATLSIVVELVGVLSIGTLSLVDPQAFPDATVWSDYGRGYLFIPAVLPLVGLWWLRTTGRQNPE